MLGDHVLIPRPQVDADIRILLPMAEEEVVLSQPLHRQPIRLQLAGDAPIAMDCWDADWTFFPALA